jgi:glycosyltransferase involved in cell wall biosynthesis
VSSLEGRRLAVVIPCFNDAATLEDAIASTAGQEPHELVVVDDGSTDAATIALLDRLRAEGVRVLRQENAGPAAARMAGVAATSAPYVFPLDADDRLAPGGLGALADALDADPDAAAAWGDELLFGRVSGKARLGRRLDPWLVTYVNEQPIASLYRRSALLEAGGWQVRSGYEDWDLWMAFAERGSRGVHVARVTHHYRVSDSGRFASNMRAHDAIVAELRGRHPDLYAGRRRNWRRSSAPLHLRLVLPLIGLLPVAEAQRSRLTQFVSHPVRLLRSRLARYDR